MRIPFDAEVNPGLGSCLMFTHDVSNMGHGPKRHLKWWEIKTLRCDVNGNKERPRRWFYTHWGALFVDWQWL